MNDEEENLRFSLSKFESMLKTNKVLFFDSEEFENIILHYLDSGKLNLAKKALKLGLDQHPNSVGLKLVQVELLVFNDKIDQAEKLVNEIYKLDPKNEEVYIQHANIYSKKGEHAKAIDTLNIALELTDDLADVYSLIGMEYLFIDELEKAKYYFIKCLENDDEDQSALYNIVYCFDFLDQPDKAIEFLNKFIDDQPYSEVAWHQLGRQYMNIKDYKNAVRAFDFATIIDEYFIGAHLEKGKAYEKLKEYTKAIESYKITLEIDDASSFVLLRIGVCYEELNKNQKALKYYLKTVHEDPLLDKGWIAITDFYIKLGNFQKALFYVNKAIGIDEQNKLYWRRYAVINKELTYFEEAEKGYSKAVEFGDMFMDTWLYWADSLQNLGEFEIAIQKLLEASEMHTDEYEIEYRLAGLYFIEEQLEKATYHLTNALHLNYKNHTILEENFPSVWINPMVQEFINKHKK